MMRPWFYDCFQCTADKCSDNCCIGWEIDIDSRAMERFRKVPGEFGERLRNAIHNGDTPTFALAAGDRCALLREDGLCELILNCGEDHLCDICALHPRFFNSFGEVEEAGLGLCCEEVCRLLFSSSEPLKFLLDEEDAAALSAEERDISCLRRGRKILTEILQERSISITERLSQCAEYGWRLQEWLDKLDTPDKLDTLDNQENDLPAIPQKWESITDPESVSRLLNTLAAMESINGEWAEFIERLVRRQEELLSALPEFLNAAGEEWRYEHIAVYSLFRHFTGCITDGAVYARVMLACCAALTVMLMDCLVWLDKGNISEWDRILNTKLYSKQVEYSQENTDAFLEEYF